MKKMKSGATFAYRREIVLLMGWKDKRVVLMMSTYHDTSMEKTGDHSERNSKANECTQLYKAYGWCRSQQSLLHNICFHSGISEVVETPFSGAWKCAL
jgi:hypothetical protein